MTDEQTISGQQLCTLSGLTDRRHRQLAKDGYFPPPIKGQYQFTPTLQGMFRYYRELQHRGNNDFAMERLRKTRAEANLAEIRLAKERKDALDRHSVVRIWENIIMVIRQKLLALPSKIAPRLIYLDDQKLLEVELDKEICGALEDLSKPRTYDATTTDEAEDEDQKGDKQRDSSPKTTTKA